MFAGNDLIMLSVVLRVLMENSTCAEKTNPEEFEDARREGSRLLGWLEAKTADYTKTLEGLDLPSALWWFIENIDDECPRRQQYYWHLRDRMAEYVHSDEGALREMVRVLAQIVYTQNGNRHEDINKILADCTLLLGPKHVIKLAAVSKEDIEGVITVDNPPTAEGMDVITRALAEAGGKAPEMQDVPRRRTKRQREIDAARSAREQRSEDYARGYRAAADGAPLPDDASPAFRTGYADGKKD